MAEFRGMVCFQPADESPHQFVSSASLPLRAELHDRNAEVGEGACLPSRK